MSMFKCRLRPACCPRAAGLAECRRTRSSEISGGCRIDVANTVGTVFGIWCRVCS